VIPAELTGAVKWTTVKIDDITKPTMDSIFLGADEVRLYVCVLHTHTHTHVHAHTHTRTHTCSD